MLVGSVSAWIYNIYPSASKGLAERLIDNGGLLLTEYPLGTTPTKYTFVERDRMQSGLSDFVFVAETSEKELRLQLNSLKTKGAPNLLGFS